MKVNFKIQRRGRRENARLTINKKRLLFLEERKWRKEEEKKEMGREREKLSSTKYKVKNGVKA